MTARTSSSNPAPHTPDVHSKSLFDKHRDFIAHEGLCPLNGLVVLGCGAHGLERAKSWKIRDHLCHLYKNAHYVGEPSPASLTKGAMVFLQKKGHRPDRRQVEAFDGLVTGRRSRTTREMLRCSCGVDQQFKHFGPDACLVHVAELLLKTVHNANMPGLFLLHLLEQFGNGRIGHLGRVPKLGGPIRDRH